MRRRMIGLLLWASVCVLHGCADPVEEPREQTDEPRSGQGDGKRDGSTKGERAEEAVQLADPHHHLVDVHTQPWDVDIAPDGRLVWVDPPPKDRLSDVVVNPAGIVFGSTATVNVAQLVASGLNMSNDAFNAALADSAAQGGAT